MTAGERKGENIDIYTALGGLLEEQDPPAQVIADALLAQALRLDDNRPVDDISVVVLRIMDENSDEVRRMLVRLPVPAIFQ